MIEKRWFGTTADGRQVFAFTLHDGESSVTVLNLGGIVQSIVVPDREGRLTDVALGYSDVAGYESNRGRLGAVIGRFANRIGDARLVVDGKEYALACDDRGYHTHGGGVGFDKKLWSYGVCGDTLALSLISPDGEENYPGRLKVTVVYTFRNRTLRLRYRAVTDRKTAVNLTNHTYFNLSGEASGSVLGQLLTLRAEEFVPTDDCMIARGGFRSVAGTPFDFRTPKAIGADIFAEDEDLRRGGGYDHCFVINKDGGGLVKFAEAESRETGIRMACYTDMPAVQFYSGNGLGQNGKSCRYGPRAGFCLETEMIPNNVNVPEYRERGSSYLDVGERYDFTTAYEFGN